MITWLASYPKSGNTFVRCVLEAVTNGKLNINYMPSSTSINLGGEWHKLPYEKFDFLEQVMFTPTACMASLEYFSECLVRKTHHANYQYLGWFLIPPQLTKRAVYVVRDPRDVAVSLSEHMGRTLDETIEIMANKNQTIGDLGIPSPVQFLSTWSNHFMSWNNKTITFPVYTIVYERLLEQPLFYFREMFDFLEIEATDEEIAKGIELSQFDKLKTQEETYGFREKTKTQDRFFTRGTSGGWRNTLTPEQAERIVDDHAEVMAKIGYPLK